MSARKKVVKKRYPPLPKEVQRAGGTLTIELIAKTIKAAFERLIAKPGDDAENMGHFDPSTRHIQVLKSLRGDQRWMVFYHELAHAALWDSGAHNAVPGAAEEMVCDAIATARLRERFG